MADNAARLKIAAAIAIGLAIPAEGLRQVAYRDPPGILTVCYGSTRNVDPARTYSLAECRARLDADMRVAIEAVERCAPGLPEPVLAAFGDAVYNLGPGIVCDRAKSTAARLLAAGDVEAACRELPKWNKARVGGVMVSLPGLSKRRAAEMAVCLEGLPPRPITPSPPSTRLRTGPAPLPSRERGGGAP
ncbi:MAG: lysozyme [Azonexus sp.]|nr:lysozyme [Azonexus sp.]